MGDRERGAIVIAFALVLLVVTLIDPDGLGTTRSFVELGLVAVGLLVGVALVLAGRRG